MKWSILFFSVFSAITLQAQIQAGVYHAKDSSKGLTHELKIDNSYFIHTIYSESPAGFVKTIGGFYNLENGVLKVELEFNSEYEEDTATSVALPLEIVENGLMLAGDNNLFFKKDSNPQPSNHQGEPPWKIHELTTTPKTITKVT